MSTLNTSIRYLVVAIAVICGMCDETHAVGSISGTVTDTASGPVSGAFVRGLLDGQVQATEITAGDGTYSITGLAPGTYDIQVEADGYEFRIETGIVVINNNDTTKNITNLAAEGIITGKVTKSDGVTPIADVLVLAGDGLGFHRVTTTDSSGVYSIKKLPAGTYTVSGTISNYVLQNNEDNVVTAGQTTSGVNLIGLNGKISGTVTESDGTTAIEGAFVLATDSTGKVAAFDMTDSSGTYELKGLATGDYTVKTWRDVGPIAEVSSVSVTDGQTTNRDLSAAGGSISGTVKNSSQTAIEGTILTAKKGNSMYNTTSDASGNYKIEALPAGTYEVSVNPNGNDYVADKIDDVTVVANQETQNQDFTLGPAGKITGTITNSSQVAIEGVLVLALDPSNTDEVYIPTTTNTNGNYTVNYLRSGTYTIIVSADYYVSDSETGVSVTAGQTTSGKNFTLGTSGGTISGTVYESDGTTPIENASVQCTSEGKSLGNTISNSNGQYYLTLLQAGTYKVIACAAGYNLETLDNVVVTVPDENSGNDFTLDEEE